MPIHPSFILSFKFSINNIHIQPMKNVYLLQILFGSTTIFKIMCHICYNNPVMPWSDTTQNHFLSSSSLLLLLLWKLGFSFLKINEIVDLCLSFGNFARYLRFILISRYFSISHFKMVWNISKKWKIIASFLRFSFFLYKNLFIMWKCLWE